MNILRNVVKPWLLLAATLSVVFAGIYLTVQQSYRIGANDPQVQMAEDAARALANGQSAESLMPGEKVDIAFSLAPYLIIYDAEGKPVASNALLHGSIPSLPAGVFDYTRQHGEDRISWQPEPGVRSATVIVSVSGGNGGYVLAGRSLREVERREDQLTTQVFLGWLGGVVGKLVLAVLLEILPLTKAK